MNLSFATAATSRAPGSEPCVGVLGAHDGACREVPAALQHPEIRVLVRPICTPVPANDSITFSYTHRCSSYSPRRLRPARTSGSVEKAARSFTRQLRIGPALKPSEAVGSHPTTAKARFMSCAAKAWYLQEL